MIDIEDFKKSIGKKSRLLGIDPGKNRLGLAISDEDKLVSTPLKTIQKKNNSNFVLEIKEIIVENNIKGIIVGNPINMAGSKGPSSQSANDSANTYQIMFQYLSVCGMKDYPARLPSIYQVIWTLMYQKKLRN